MKLKIFFLLWFIHHITVIGQSVDTSQQSIYKDRITDETGTPIAGVKVQVEGTGTYTYSDFDGRFSIRASMGDVVVLSLDGKRINSYRLDGSQDYYIFDQRNEEKAKDKTSKIDTYSKSNNPNYLDSAQFYKIKKPFKSIDFVEKKLQSDRAISKAALALSYALLGENYFAVKQYDLAISNYKKSLNNKSSVSVKLLLAESYTLARDYKKSQSIYQEIIQTSSNEFFIMEAAYGMAQSFDNQGDYPQAIKHYQVALSWAEKQKNISKTTEINTRIAKILAKKGEKEKSNIYLENSLKAVASETSASRINSQNQVADVYQANKAYDQEIALRKKTISEMEAISLNLSEEETTDNIDAPSITISQQNLEIGRAYIDKREYDKAIPYLEKSVASAQRINNLEIEKNALQKLSELYKSIGNSKKALEKYQEYALLVDKLYKQKEQEIFTAVEMSNELRDKQNRINSLEKDRNLTESKIQLIESENQLSQANFKRQKMLIYGLGIGLLLLMATVWAMYKSNQQKKMANNLLALKSLRTQMNPHFIFNALNSVNSFIAQNDERAANRYLTDFSTLMRSVLNNSEKDLIPLDKEIELIKLYTQLEHSRFTDKFDFEIFIDENLNEEVYNIPPMLIQPYVENAVWHGLRYKETKGKLDIKFMQQTPDTVQISIADNGIGRKKSKDLKTQNQKKQESKGMQNIKKRIEILNEMYANKIQVFIQDLHADGSGTKVEILLKR